MFWNLALPRNLPLKGDKTGPFVEPGARAAYLTERDGFPGIEWADVQRRYGARLSVEDRERRSVLPA